MRAGTFIPILAAMTLAATMPHTAAAQDNDSAPGQSIQVHGHWIIEVYDGEELVERREFDNALAPGGAALLSYILVQDSLAIDRQIHLYTPDDVRYRLCPLLESFDCDGGGLTVTAPTSGDNAGALVLEWSGQMEGANLPATFDEVRTTFYAVADTASAVEVGPWLTAKTLDPSVDLKVDQTMYVTVIISFTSG